jgi:hypothetical protein
MQGVVTKISHDGLVISLWGDMRGFAPRSHLSTETIEYPEKLFFVGQVRFSFLKKFLHDFFLSRPWLHLRKHGSFFYVALYRVRSPVLVFLALFALLKTFFSRFQAVKCEVTGCDPDRKR